MTTIQERVLAGSAWLDEHRPGWVDRIDLETLDLGNGCHCVLGQEYHGFSSGLVEVDSSATWPRTAAGLGFYARAELYDHAPEREYDILTDAWRAFITARREQSEVSV